MLSIIRLADGAAATCEPHQIATLLKTWTDQDPTIVDADFRQVLHETAEALQDAWFAGYDSSGLQTAMRVRIEHID